MIDHINMRSCGIDSPALGVLNIVSTLYSGFWEGLVWWLRIIFLSSIRFPNYKDCTIVGWRAHLRLVCNTMVHLQQRSNSWLLCGGSFWPAESTCCAHFINHTREWNTVFSLPAALGTPLEWCTIWRRLLLKYAFLKKQLGFQRVACQGRRATVIQDAPSFGQSP